MEEDYLAFRRMRARKKRRRKALVSTVIVGVQRLRAANKSRTRLNWAQHKRTMSTKEFVRRYRLNKKNFAMVLRHIAADITSGPQCQKNGPVTADIKLAITLRYLAGGAYQDVADIHHVEAASVHTYVWRVVRALRRCKALQLQLLRNDGTGLLDDVTRLKPLADAYAARGRGEAACYGAFGAIDGIAIKVKRPKVNPTDYFCRKGFYSLNCQAVCGANRQVLWVSVKATGSAHDSTALYLTDLGHVLEDSTHPIAQTVYHLLGDDAYKGPAANMFNNLLTPIPTGCTPEEDVWNYYQSSRRMTIENTFGEMVARWGVLWRKMGFREDRATALLEALCILHNVCVGQREPIRHSTTAGARDGAWQDLPETNV